MKIFYLLQQTLLASTIARTFSEADHHARPPKIKHANPHQESTSKERPPPFEIVESKFITAYRNNSYKQPASSTHARQFDQPINSTYRYSSIEHTKLRAPCTTKKQHAKKIHLSLRRPSAKAMARTQLAMPNLHQPSIPGILATRPVTRARRSDDDPITSIQWQTTMRSTELSLRAQQLSLEIRAGIAQLEAHPPTHTQASALLRYSLLRYTHRHTLNLLEQWSENPSSANNVRLRTTKTLLQQLSAQLSAYEKPVPKRISTVWIGGITPVLQDYFYCILSAAEAGHEISLLYDPHATLAAVLGKKIKEFSAHQKKDFVHPDFSPPEGTQKKQKHSLEKLILTLQNQAYTAIKNGMKEGLSFDTCAINFMVNHLGEERASLEKLRHDHLNSYAQLNHIAQNLSHKLGNRFTLKAITKDLFTLPNDPPHLPTQRYDNYILEAGLRNNLAAASDLVRVFDLHQHGGVYRDMDLLPNVRDEIFSSDPSLKSDLHKFINKEIRTVWLKKDALYGLQYDVLWQQLASDLPSHQPIQKENQLTTWINSFSSSEEGHGLVTRMQQAVHHYKTTHRDIKDFFVPLDQVKVGPIDIAMLGIYDNENAVAINNNVLAAQPHSLVLKQFIENLDDIYSLLQEPGMGMQYPDLAPDSDGPLPKHNSGTQETIEWVERNTWRRERQLEPLVEKPVYLPILPGLRLDGIDSESKATIFISGPTSLSDTISDYIYASIDSETYEQVNAALQNPPIPNKNPFNYAKTLQQNIEGESSSESTTSSWISDAGERQNDIVDSTQYDHTLILQLERDAKINLAARFLNNKHPEKTIWLAPIFYNQDQYILDTINQPPTRALNPNAKIRVMVLGHGRTVDGKIQFSEKNGQQLANLLTNEKARSKFLAPGQSITRISLVGCNLASEASSNNDVTANRFIVDLFNSLKENGVSVKDITARTGPMRVSPRGKKLVQLTASPQWQHHDGKIIFTQDSKGTVHHQSAPTYIDGPLPEPAFIVGSTEPLAWGGQSQKHVTTQLTKQFYQAVSKVRTAHNLDADWIPLLNTLKNTAGETKIQWLNTKDPDQGLRRTSTSDTIFAKIKTYADIHLANLQTTHQWVDNTLIPKPHVRPSQQISFFKKIERGTNDLLAINTLINALRHPIQTVESTLDKVLTLHSYLTITQATATLTSEASHLFTRNLENKNSAIPILAKAEQFGAAINNAANHAFNIANLGFDITELMLSRGPEQARYFATQLGFDASISTSFAIEGIAETLGVDAIASVAGPIGWILLIGEIVTLSLIDSHHAIHQTAEDIAAVDDYLTTTLSHYRTGGFHFDEKNKALVPLRNVIIEKIDLQNGITTLKSPTLSRIKSISTQNGTMVNIPKRIPLEFKITFAQVNDDALPLSQYLHLPRQASMQHLKQARIIVLPDTPDTKFHYTITPNAAGNENKTSHNNAYLTHQLIPKPCQPCTTPYQKNLLSLWLSTRLVSLQPSYQLTSTTVILDAYPRTLVVPPRQFNHSYMLYEMTGGGNTATLIPQRGAKFLFNSGAKISRWLIDARSFPLASLHCEPGYFRIGEAEFTLGVTTNNDIFMLKTRSHDVLQIDMRQGNYQYNVIDMYSKPFVDIDTRLKRLAHNKKLMPYVAVINLPGLQPNARQKTVALFDTQRQLFVPACVDGDITIAGVGTKEQSLNPYFFAKTDGSILWRVNAKRKKIVMQWRTLLAEYQDMRITGVYQKNNMTLLEQQIPVRYHDEMHALNNTISLTSAINQNDAIKCIDITFPANKIDSCLDTLRTFLPSVATEHIGNRDELILQQILPLNDLTLRTTPIEKIDTAQHLRQAGYARFVRLSDQENTKHAWLWLEKARLLEPRCQLSEQTLPNFTQLLSVSEAEIPVGVTADGCHFRIHTDNHIEFIGVSGKWITAHWETLSSDLDHMAQQTNTATFITLSGLMEHVVPTDHEKIGKIIPQQAWYDTEEEQFMIVPSDLKQAHIVYLGSDHNGGGWLYDQEQQHLYYADLVNPFLLKTLFASDLEAKTAHWQTSERLFSDQSIDNVRRQNDGRIVVCTNDGLIFLVDHHEEESGQGPLLLAVTSDWQDAHEETLTADLNILKLRYATNDHIEVVNTVNRAH